MEQLQQGTEPGRTKQPETAAGGQNEPGEQALPVAGTQPHELSVIGKREEAAWLRDETLKQIDWQQSLLLAVLVVGGTFLSLGLQPGISGLTAMLFPILACALAMKLSAHDLRVGQINFHLRFLLRSPWEIARRALFDGKDLCNEERRVLEEQGITLTHELVAKGKLLGPPLADMHSRANRLAILSVEIAALAIGGTRTYPAVIFHPDSLTICVWVLAILATMLTMLVLRRKRVR